MTTTHILNCACWIVISIAVLSCSRPANVADRNGLSDDSLFTLVQHNTFQYFWNGAEPVSGAARERIHLWQLSR